MFHRYLLFGLTLDSELPLPGVLPAEPAAPADLVIRSARLEPGLPRGSGLHHLGDDVALFCVPEVGRYLCRGGRELLVEPAGEVPAANLRLYLLGSAMGLILHQRGLLPIHANAVEFGGQAVLFLGPSGWGKSTLAAWLHDRGHLLIADDVAVVGDDPSGGPIVHPGLPRFRLWREALERSGRCSSGFSRSYVDDSDWDKFDVPAEHRASAPTPLGAVVVLREGDGEVQPLRGAAAVQSLFSNVYRGEFLTPGQHAAHWRTCLGIVRSVPVLAWHRRWGHEVFEEEIAKLLSGLRELFPSPR